MSYSREELEKMQAAVGLKNPSTAPAGPSPEMVARMKLLEMKAERFGHVCAETIHPALADVDALLKQRDDLLDLCGNMLATIKLQQNQGKLSGPHWENFVESCVKRFNRNGGEM